jgi:Spy/CpxP family protein refolding chaperone
MTLQVPAIRRRHVGLLAAVLAVTVIAQAAEERRKWWQSQRVQEEIGLSPSQVQALERIFQETLPGMREERANLDLRERTLSKLLREATADETEIMLAIDRVETIRARASKVRLLMLYRMYRVLTPNQRQSLKVMQERSRSQRGGTNAGTTP